MSPAPEQKSECKDLPSLPGLIDVQVNGYRGVDFSDVHLTEEDFARTCRELFDAGTTAFLPTLITSPPEVYERNLPLIAGVIATEEFRGRVLGIHIEGPFLSPLDGARGAHDAQWIRRPDVDYLQRLIELAQGTVRLVTIAADQEGAADLSRYASSHGVAVSLGHHMADEQDLERLVAVGAKALTHLGNGLPALLPRHQNPLWAGLANDDLLASIITDGHHLPPAVLKTILRTKGPGRCLVISDASPLAGLAPGDYRWMGAAVRLQEDGKVVNPATGYMAGSSATILACANHLAQLGLVGLSELGQMCFYNPLRLIGMSPKQVRPAQRILFDARNHRVCQESAS